MLAPRQKEIVEALARGEGLKTIAYEQGVSLRTVEGNIKLARKKANARNIVQLVAVAVREGWIE